MSNTFREMHSSGCFVLPNPWDVGSARLLRSLGFQALATTSAGFAFSRGRPDSVSALSLDEVLAHVEEIVRATPLPVSADFQSGYAVEPEAVFENVTRCLATGVAGLSIEDATGDAAAPLFETGLAIERVRAACRARDESSARPVITARSEALLLGVPDAERIALERLAAFADAGADCLFAPGARDSEQVRAIVEAVAPKPVNVLVAAPHPDFTVERLAGLGVRRISLGSALARAAWGKFLEAAESLATAGTFDALAGAASFVRLDGVFGPD